MDATLDLFAAADGTGAKPVLADGGSAERIRFPGRAAADRSIGLDDAGWARFAEGVARACGLARTRGFEPTFHHHTATFVEAPWEIERVLELTDVGLLLDTGHLRLGGGDPTTALRDWGDRINHIHIKDVHDEVLAGVIADAADMPEAWRRGVFCELGTGDVDLDSFFGELARSDYSGWLVVEQDMVPRSTRRTPPTRKPPRCATAPGWPSARVSKSRACVHARSTAASRSGTRRRPLCRITRSDLASATHRSSPDHAIAVGAPKRRTRGNVLRRTAYTRSPPGARSTR